MVHVVAGFNNKVADYTLEGDDAKQTGAYLFPLVPKYQGASSFFELPNTEQLLFANSEEIRESVINYNFHTMFAVEFIAIAIFAFILGLLVPLGIPLGVLTLFIALNFLSGRQAEKKNVETIENKYRTQGKNYYEALAQEKKQKVKKPEFHWWGATHLQFV